MAILNEDVEIQRNGQKVVSVRGLYGKKPSAHYTLAKTVPVQEGDRLVG